MTETKVYLNTWGAYNAGCVGFGWMPTDEAIKFMDDKTSDEDFTEKFGDEWFVADIENHTEIELDIDEYDDPRMVCEAIDLIDELEDYEQEEVQAVLEWNGVGTITPEAIEEAISKKDFLTIYHDEDDYFSLCDECLTFHSDIEERYFDYDAYHRDCLYDVYQASNGCIIME